MQVVLKSNIICLKILETVKVPKGLRCEMFGKLETFTLFADGGTVSGRFLASLVLATSLTSDV